MLDLEPTGPPSGVRWRPPLAGGSAPNANLGQHAQSNTAIDKSPLLSDAAPLDDSPRSGGRLAAEYEAALSQTRQSDLRPLMDAGVSVRLMWCMTPAITRIRRLKEWGETYEPDPDGGEAYLLPVRVSDPITPEATVPFEAVCSADIIDLVAFHPQHPARWALRTGSAEWLGAIPPQYMRPDAVPVWRSPLSWMRAGCVGLVPLTREPPAIYRLLSGFRELAVQDEEHEAELRSVLERPWPIPRIIVGGEK